MQAPDTKSAGNPSHYPNALGYSQALAVALLSHMQNIPFSQCHKITNGMQSSIILPHAYAPCFNTVITLTTLHVTYAGKQLHALYMQNLKGMRETNTILGTNFEVFVVNIGQI